MTSRLCVKNIGKGTSEDKIRSIFSAKGEVTDVKIIKTKSGKSREFAFVGFRTEQQANAAHSYFNNSYIGTSKIQIEAAQKLTSVENIENPENLRSRHSKKKLEAYQKAKEKQAKAEAQTQSKSHSTKAPVAVVKMSTEMQEFQSVMTHKRAGAVWDNDTAALQESVTDIRPTDQSDSESDEDDDVNDMTMDNSANSDEEEEEEDVARVKKGAAFDSAVSDLDFLKSKVSRKLDSDSDSDGDFDGDSDGGSSSSGSSVKNSDPMANSMDEDAGGDVEAMSDTWSAAKAEEDADSGRLFVRNIPYTCDEDELRALFEPFGAVSEVHIPVHKHARLPAPNSEPIAEADLSSLGELEPDGEQRLKYNKGFGFVQFLFPESATRAQEAVDGSSFQGRLLHIVLAQRKVEEPDAEVAGAGRGDEREGRLSSYQKKLEADRKRLMSRVEGWNSSYVRADSAVDSLAKSFGVKSSDIMDTETKSAGEIAVAVAVSENQVIQENKEFFAAHSIDLGAMESSLSSSRAAKRSSTALLVKNLRHGTADKDELENMFAKFGPVTHFLMPPNMSVAYVEYVEATTARSAFKHLAYKRYHNMPLYLEWAPLRMSKDATGGASSGSKAVDKGKPTNDVVGTSSNSVVDCAMEFGTIYIKNLNFKSGADDIKALLVDRLKCCKPGDIRGVVIPTKPVGKTDRSGPALSMGYGFVEVSSITMAVSMLAQVNGAVLDGHKLEAKLSEKRISTSAGKKEDARTRSVGSSGSQDRVSSKLVIRNIAFQTSVDELKKLCSVYGNIKTIRLPKKGVNANNSTINQHRGFAFVEYHSKKEAELAFNQLKLVHLYGRHLVCEYATAGDMNDVSLSAIGTSSGADASSSSGGKSLKSLREKVKLDMKAIDNSKAQNNKRKTMDDGDEGAGAEVYSRGSKRNNSVSAGYMD